MSAKRDLWEAKKAELSENLNSWRRDRDSNHEYGRPYPFEKSSELGGVGTREGSRRWDRAFAGIYAHPMTAVAPPQVELHGHSARAYSSTAALQLSGYLIDRAVPVPPKFSRLLPRFRTSYCTAADLRRRIRFA